MAHDLLAEETYVVKAMNISNVCGITADFLTDTLILSATESLLSSYSAGAEDGQVKIKWNLSKYYDGVFAVKRRGTPSGYYIRIYPDISTADRRSFVLFDDAVDSGGIYEYRVESVDEYGESRLLLETGAIEVGVVGIVLSQNHPNPFNPSTEISFYIPRAGYAQLKVYDTNGRLVRTLADGVLTAGKHTARWNGLDGGGNRVTSGIYFYRLRAGKNAMTRKMVLLR